MSRRVPTVLVVLVLGAWAVAGALLVAVTVADFAGASSTDDAPFVLRCVVEHQDDDDTTTTTDPEWLDHA